MSTTPGLTPEILAERIPAPAVRRSPTQPASGLPRTQVKVVVDQSEHVVERELNAFLGERDAIDIVDIKWSTTPSDEGYWFSALVIYRTREVQR